LIGGRAGTMPHDAAVRRLELLYIVGTFPKVSETFVANEIFGLAERGHRLTVALLRRGEGPLPAHGGVRYLEVPFPAVLMHAPFAGRLRTSEPGENLQRKLYAGAAARWVARRVEDRRPDIVHAHFINRPTLVARQVAARLRVPVTFMTHASDYRVGTSPAAVRERIRTASAAFVVSESARQQLSEIIRDPEVAVGRNVHVVRACMGRFQVSMAPRSGPSTRLEIVTVARLVPKKGIDLALRAFARLVESSPDARYRIAGDGPELSRLAALAEQLGIADRVSFLGLVSPAEARALLGTADIALLPCRVDASGDVDGIPVSLMEAGAAGVAVISTRVSGIPELVESGHSGILTEPDDVDALVSALVRLSKDATWRGRLANNLRVRVASEFSQDRQVSRLERVWNGLAGGCGNGGTRQSMSVTSDAAAAAV